MIHRPHTTLTTPQAKIPNPAPHVRHRVVDTESSDTILHTQIPKLDERELSWTISDGIVRGVPA